MNSTKSSHSENNFSTYDSSQDSSPNSSQIFIGLGSNLGDPKVNIENIKKYLEEQVSIVKQSSLYLTKAVGPIQPDYVNQVIQVDTELDAHNLLTFLLESEKRFGRVRASERNMPRTIDCDLLIYNKEIINSSELILPHPRISERAFVIIPLLEIASVDNEIVSWALGVEKLD